jgi:hypothetical protein
MAMFPPLFDTVKANAGVRTIFGRSPRIYPHGMAPDADSQGFATPYAVFQIVTGVPENYLGDLPDGDEYTIQIDVYAATVAEAASGAQALRDAIEPVAYIAGWRGQFKDVDTQLFRYSFDVDWQTDR